MVPMINKYTYSMPTAFINFYNAVQSSFRAIPVLKEDSNHAIPRYDRAKLSFIDGLNTNIIRRQTQKNCNDNNLLPVIMKQMKNAAEKSASILPQFFSDIFPLDTPEISWPDDTMLQRIMGNEHS